MTKWYEVSYSRLLIDNHITEEDPSFMKLFSPEHFVSKVKRSKVDATMVYACCHNGNCYYPTKVGHMHKNLQGRDIFGETIALLRKENITPVAYYTWIFHNHSSKTNPNWRMLNPTGESNNGRYWWSCPNQRDYMEFSKSQIAEIITYDVDGIFIDMTFWPIICTCNSCHERYLTETGADIPRIINWNDPAWVKFQRARERWLGNFAEEITLFIKKQKNNISVTHQFSPVLLGWRLGQSPAISAASEYCSGDFYGGKYQQRIATKTFAAFTQNTPFEFLISRCVDLKDHTSSKSEAEMLCSSSTTLANGGACCFIDAINPDGTLDAPFYNTLNKINGIVKPFKQKLAELRPALLSDVGLYFSMSSAVNETTNGLHLLSDRASIGNMDSLCEVRNINELIGTSVALNRANIPYQVVTEKTVDFSAFQTIIINNAFFMSKEEVDRIRNFVFNGGTLIATGKTSLCDLDGNTNNEFALTDVFGVSYTNKMSKRVNYLAEYESGVSILCNDCAPLVTATTAKALAYVAEPYFDSDDIEHYASIHSNPPGPSSQYAGLTVNTYGKGKCIYLYSSLLALRQNAQETFGVSLFRKYITSGLFVNANYPACVEVTLLKSTVSDKYLLCFVNYQNELPNIPVCNVQVTIKLPSKPNPKVCQCISGYKGLEVKTDHKGITIDLPYLDTIEMVEIE